MVAKRARLKECRIGGRFDPRLARARVENLRARAGVEPKDVGQVVWPNQRPENASRSWWRIANQEQREFTLPELDRIIDYLVAEGLGRGRLKSQPPPGFPFVEFPVHADEPPENLTIS